MIFWPVGIGVECREKGEVEWREKRRPKLQGELKIEIAFCVGSGRGFAVSLARVEWREKSNLICIRSLVGSFWNDRGLI
jgi:hypothetical protein